MRVIHLKASLYVASTNPLRGDPGDLLLACSIGAVPARNKVGLIGFSFLGAASAYLQAMLPART